MDLKILWQDINTVNTSIRIYRGDTPINKDSLPSPVATLGTGITTWTDPNAVRGKFYYYMFETYSTDDRVFSQNYYIQAVPRLGPGPNELKEGNYELGFFGTLTSSEFISNTGLRNLVGFQAGLGGTPTQVNVAPLWYKYARNGKVLIIPNAVLGQSITGSQVYAAGLYYGTNDNGPAGNPFIGTPVNQNKRVTIGPDTFIVRLMRGYSDTINNIPSAQVANTEPTEYVNEWNDLVYPLCRFVPNGQRLTNNANMAVTGEMITGPNNGFGQVLVQEFSTGASPGAVVRRANVQGTGRAAISNRGANADGYLAAWWPVLELVAPIV